MNTKAIELSIKAKKVSADIIDFIKTSNLNFVINQTPYSSYITICNKFQKSLIDAEGNFLVTESNDIDNKIANIVAIDDQIKTEENLNNLLHCENSDLKEALKKCIDNKTANIEELENQIKNEGN